MGPEEYERHRQCRQDDPHPKLDAHFDRMFDRQLDDRLAKKESATTAMLLGVADRAIARLEALATGHRQRAEAHAAQQSAILSFDASAEGERLRRYQFACSRSLFRSLDTLMKVRRSGLGAGSGEDRFTTEAAETKTEPCSVFGVPCPVNPPIDRGDWRDEPVSSWESCDACAVRRSSDAAQVQDRTSPPLPAPPIPHTTDASTQTSIDDRNRQDEPAHPPVDHQNLQDEAMVVDHRNPQDEPKASQVPLTAHRRLPFHRAVIFAMTLFILFGAAGRLHRNLQIEPTPRTVANRNPRNEATAAPHRVVLVDDDAIGEPPGTPPSSAFRGMAVSSPSPLRIDGALRAGMVRTIATSMLLPRQLEPSLADPELLSPR